MIAWLDRGGEARILRNCFRFAGILMNRREFLYTTALGLAAAAVAPAQEYDRDKRRRVGLIACGWYGKSDKPRGQD
jgi:hypothetical protein